MFSIVYGVLLRPLPYRDAHRLLLVRAEVDYAGAHRPVPVLVQTTELPAWQRPFDSLAAPAFYAVETAVLSGDNGSEVLDSAVVSAHFFRRWKVRSQPGGHLNQPTTRCHRR